MCASAQMIFSLWSRHCKILRRPVGAFDAVWGRSDEYRRSERFSACWRGGACSCRVPAQRCGALRRKPRAPPIAADSRAGERPRAIAHIESARVARLPTPSGDPYQNQSAAKSAGRAVRACGRAQRVPAPDLEADGLFSSAELDPNAMPAIKRLVTERTRFRKNDLLFRVEDRFDALYAIRIGPCKTVLLANDG